MDFAYQLSADPGDPAWHRSQFTGGQDFRERKMILDEFATNAVFADISAFYENIDISMLVSDLRSINVDPG